jgi:hypothetical protein
MIFNQRGRRAERFIVALLRTVGANINGSDSRRGHRHIARPG